MKIDKKKLIKIGFAIGGTAFGIWLIGRYLTKQRENQADIEVLNSLEGKQAQALRVAMNPSGSDWYFGADGTNEKMLFEIASKIKDINKVAKIYENRYGSKLSKDLENELSDNELIIFWESINNANKKTLTITKPESKKVIEVKKPPQVDLKNKGTKFKKSEVNSRGVVIV